MEDAAEPTTPAPRDAVLVFVRAPEAGRVKTRLAAALGPEAALRVYRRLAEHTVAQARALGGDVEVRVCFTPPGQGACVAGWLGAGPRYLPQSGGDLGERMQEAFARAFAEGRRRVVVVGSDLPALSAAHLRRALDLLEHRPAVVGPAADGGYWLLGLRAPAPRLFAGVPWSTSAVLARTLERLREGGQAPALLPRLADVDTVDDLPPGWREWALIRLA